MHRLELIANYLVSFLILLPVAFLAMYASDWLLRSMKFPLGIIILIIAGFLMTLLAPGVKQRNWRAAFTKSSIRLAIIQFGMPLFLSYTLASIFGLTPENFLKYMVPVFAIMAYYRNLTFFTWGRNQDAHAQPQ